MRLARLDLTRYGKFADHPLVFNAIDGCDLQFIVGPNEAGKTTIRQAIHDLFYGIEKSSPYGYKHGLPDMEIAAVVEADGAELRFRRLKKKQLRDTLVTPEGALLEEGLLVRLMGHADEAFYLRMFGLNHPTLVAGAKEMLKSSGDVGQMLFQAAAGVTGLHQLREVLEAEAAGLWTERKNMSCAYYIARNQFTEAEADLKRVSVSSVAWQKLKRALDAAEGDLTTAQERYGTAERERQRLDRVRRVTPYLRQRDEDKKLLAALGPAPLLPADAGATLATAASAIATADGNLALLRKRLADDTNTVAAITVNAAVIAHKGEIDSLAGRVQTYMDAKRDLPDLKAQRDGKSETALNLAGQLGWTVNTLSDIEAKLPTRVVRTELTALGQEEPAKNLAVAQAREKLDDQNESISALGKQIDEAPSATALPALAAVVHAATAANLAARSTLVRQRARTAEDDMRAAFTALAPWSGNESALRSLVLPSAAELASFTDRRSQLQSQRSQSQRTLATKRAEAVKAKAALDVFHAQHKTVVLEELLHARCERDTLWRKVRAGEVVAADAGDRYEASVVAADGLADRRYEGAAKIEQQATLQSTHASLVAEIGELEAQIAAVDKALLALQDEWDTTMAALGLTLTQAQLAAWADARADALTTADALRNARSEIDGLAEEERAVVASLRAALEDAGAEVPADATIGWLAAQAEALQKSLAASETCVGQWRGQLRTAQLALPALQRKEEATRTALDTWAAAWQRKLAAAGLATDLSPQAATSAVELLKRIDDACREVRDNCGPRVEQMTREIASFTQRAEALATACVPQAAGEPPHEIAALLREELRSADSNANARANAQSALQKTRDELDRVDEDKVAAEATLKSLFDIVKVDSVEALRLAVAAAEQYREVAVRIEKAEADARVVGDHRPLVELEVEVDATDFAQIEGLLLDAKAACDTAQTLREGCIRAHTQAKAAFEQIAGQADAVRAESRRRDALLGMSEAVNEYVRITVGVRLVKWAVDRYSEERQQPLLKRASALFAGLTGGRFTKLSVNFEAEPPELIAHRADGSHVVIGGLSTGTEDQLFLALRLAALELHLDAGTPLPLILDDIFINWSDERTAAGFAVLAEIAKRTQVIVLSHHEHLLHVARAATGNRINVIALTA
jgi:uncharacterized protein YhaN